MRSLRSARVLAPLLVALATLAARTNTVEAQGSLREQTREVAGGPRQHIVAVNPFLPLAGYFQGEYERRVRNNLSLAVGASYVPWNRDILNADVKLRLYPQDRALEGLGIAAGLGVGRMQQDDEYGACAPIDCVPPIFKGKMITAPAFSIEGQYQWLLGASRSTAVSVGGGLKRYFIADQDTRGLVRVVPTGRLTIGWAFR